MNTLDRTPDEQLRTIGAICPRLLSALHDGPEAVWGEIQAVETACRAFAESRHGVYAKAEAAMKMMGRVAALRAQMGKQGLMDDGDFAKFREDVLAIQQCAEALRGQADSPAPPDSRSLKSYVFHCSNFLDAGEFAGYCRRLYGESVKTVSLPCSGKVDVQYLTKAFETGADGVVIVTCKKLECRHFEGNLRARKRAEAVESLLEEIGLGAGRMAVIECGERGVGQVFDEIKHFLDRIKNLRQPCIRTSVPAAQERTQA
jgi:F420-non-reducing hydrogenase iron-sulfur subunit